MRRVFPQALLIAFLLTGCAAPYLVPRYESEPANASALTALGVGNVEVGAFEEVPFDSSCRGLHALALPDGMSPGQYFRKALEIELQKAHVPASQAGRVTLSGKVESVGFSSMTAITMGVWNIRVSLRSSNGKALQASESHEFDSGFAYQEACRNTAQEFPKGVQKLIARLFADPAFPSLLR